MVNRPKQIGTAAETAVTRATHTRGFPFAERRALAGSKDKGDILLTAGVVVEVKGGEEAKSASDKQIDKWLDETETERLNARADVAFLVTQRRGVGPKNAHRWWAWWPLDYLISLADDRPIAALSVPTERIPVRMTLDDALTILREVGYGTPLDDASLGDEEAV